MTSSHLTNHSQRLNDGSRRPYRRAGIWEGGGRHGLSFTRRRSASIGAFPGNGLRRTTENRRERRGEDLPARRVGGHPEGGLRANPGSQLNGDADVRPPAGGEPAAYVSTDSVTARRIVCSRTAGANCREGPR